MEQPPRLNLPGAPESARADSTVPAGFTPAVEQALAAGACIALAILALAVVLAEVGVFSIAQALGKQYPEFAHLEAPLLTLTVALACCIEIVLVATALLVAATRTAWNFGPQPPRLVDTLIVASAAGAIVVAGSLPLIPGPPALGLLLFACVIVGVAAVLLLLLVRSRLRAR